LISNCPKKIQKRTTFSYTMNHKPVSDTAKIEQPHSKLETDHVVPEEDEENHGGADEVGQEFEPLGS